MAFTGPSQHLSESYLVGLLKALAKIKGRIPIKYINMYLHKRNEKQADHIIKTSKIPDWNIANSTKDIELL